VINTTEKKDMHMSEQEAALNEKQDERFKQTIAVLIAVVTLCAAIIAYLQSDAGARDDRANRDNKRYALEAFGQQVRGNAEVNYAYNSAYQSWQELDLLATSAANRGDEAAAQRYTSLRDQARQFSPLLDAPYFDESAGEVDLARYEVDTYLVAVTGLQEAFLASSVVKDAWDAKANTYIVHLTLLAVALFLFGLSLVTAGGITRWIFTTTGGAITLLALVWAGSVYAQPVVDLRDQGQAIQAYAQGMGLAYQKKHKEAIAAFDTALQAAPDYANALAQRAEAQSALGNWDAAAADYEKARAAGDQSGNTAGELAWIYYLQGRFDEAIAMNRTALQATPGELWIQYDLALSLLTAGQLDAAKAEYAAGMKLAAEQVAAAKAAGAEPPSYLWWGLDDAAAGLDDLVAILDGEESAPPLDKISNGDAIRPVADELISQIKSLAVALEYTGQPPSAPLTAQISPFAFAKPIYDAAGEVTDYTEIESVPYSTQAVAVLFDYTGMADGQEVLFKVYINGEEDPSWRVIFPWEAGAEGSYEKPLSLDYSDNFVLVAGYYTVEIYVDGQLAQRGSFVVEEE
jgi:tetratricopeptide (TPR) repeat protein